VRLKRDPLPIAVLPLPRSPAGVDVGVGDGVGLAVGVGVGVAVGLGVGVGRGGLAQAVGNTAEQASASITVVNIMLLFFISVFLLIVEFSVF
jgi:hypothetical protein